VLREKREEVRTNPATHVSVGNREKKKKRKTRKGEEEKKGGKGGKKGHSPAMPQLFRLAA